MEVEPPAAVCACRRRSAHRPRAGTAAPAGLRSRAAVAAPASLRPRAAEAVPASLRPLAADAACHLPRRRKPAVSAWEESAKATAAGRDKATGPPEKREAEDEATKGS